MAIINQLRFDVGNSMENSRRQRPPFQVAQERLRRLGRQRRHAVLAETIHRVEELGVEALLWKKLDVNKSL